MSSFYFKHAVANLRLLRFTTRLHVVWILLGLCVMVFLLVVACLGFGELMLEVRVDLLRRMLRRSWNQLLHGLDLAVRLRECLIQAENCIGCDARNSFDIFEVQRPFC
eukprot:gnl/TRDRNA2_/TRDRNA2_117442_c0_seq1.p1 gnl/TRDRNA2_/TRDRNA2_117442_c0~~gnl/TRDRNA2_/TRDRNA2_117442_c0_seq1.p1  ORF type:complete len:108 (+),score=6.78 gnl/TRDRNA2_/TRDRNA2_117442_c0_seq1:162-485(+)